MGPRPKPLKTPINQHRRDIKPPNSRRSIDRLQTPFPGVDFEPEKIAERLAMERFY